MILLKALGNVCVGAAAKMEMRRQLRAKWTDLQTCLQQRTIKALPCSLAVLQLYKAPSLSFFRALQCVRPRNKRVREAKLCAVTLWLYVGASSEKLKSITTMVLNSRRNLGKQDVLT